MTKRIVRPLLLLTALATLLPTAHAQWPAYPSKRVPRTKDGKVDMAAKPPRTYYGKTDLSGLWLPTNPTKFLLNFAADMKDADIPLTPLGKATLQERIANNGKDHPGVSCLPSGIPEKLSIPDGLKIVQTEDLTLMLHESRTIYRQIFTDGRPLPKNAQPMWMGYSVGRWEGDTFVVETIGQNGRTWLDMRGLPGSESMKVTERYTRPNVGRMLIEVTVEDPVNYTKPITSKLDWTLLPDDELIESICEENNKDPRHMVGK
ncbi:MAG: hypothetical protein RL328_1233 [Acidobacteriota bacterium]|jgi:hypothetical protein